VIVFVENSLCDAVGYGIKQYCCYGEVVICCQKLFSILCLLRFRTVFFNWAVLELLHASFFLRVKPMGSLHVHLLGGIHYNFLTGIPYVGAIFCRFN
jgi:hypothetical protein